MVITCIKKDMKKDIQNVNLYIYSKIIEKKYDILFI